MVDSAVKAQVILKKENNNKFAREKINTSLFYCNTYLPFAISLENTIKKSYYPLENFAWLFNLISDLKANSFLAL